VLEMMSVALATLDIGVALAHNKGTLKLWQKEMNAMYFTVKMTNFLNRVSGSKPTIDRMNVRTYNRMGKYYVGASASGKFMQVNDGKHIRYYGNPFWNLYRVVSKNGNDFVIHEAR
jgi:hypothetical protein